MINIMSTAVNVKGVNRVNPKSSHHKGDLGSILGLERTRGEGHGNPLQYSYLENSMDRGACWVTVHRIEKVGHD